MQAIPQLLLLEKYEISTNKKSWDRFVGKIFPTICRIFRHTTLGGVWRKRRNKGSPESGLTFPILPNLALARFLLKLIRFDAVGNLLSLASACFSVHAPAVAQVTFHQGTGTRRGRRVDVGIAMVAARRRASVNWATKVSIYLKSGLAL